MPESPSPLAPSLRLEARQAGGGQVIPVAPGRWVLKMPATPATTYALAQLDDYLPLPRSCFRWRAPLHLEVEARVSAPALPGTWGFGLWNDPFARPLGVRGTARRMPAWPNAAWFFHASPLNYLSLRDDLPGYGFLAATLASPTWPVALLAPGIVALPALLWPTTARLLRRLLGRFIHQDALHLDVDVTAWHRYDLDWEAGRVRFAVDGQRVFETPVSPRGRLGLVLWIDNQFAAFTPAGTLRFGLEAMPPAGIEIRLLRVTAKK